MDSGPGTDEQTAAGETDTALGALFDAAAQPLALIGADGRILRANPALARALGRAGHEELAGERLADLACPSDDGALAAALAAPGTAAANLSLRCQRRDGGHVWLDCGLSAPDARGCVLAQFHDAGEALRLPRHSRAVEALTGVGSWEADLETGTVWWSPRVFAIHGLDPAGTMPDTEAALAFYPDEARASLRRALALLAETGTPFDLELPFTDAAGRARWVRATGGADMADGCVLRTYGTFEDVTEALVEREHHRRLAAIAESTVNGVVVTDRDGRTDWVNATFTRMTGYTQEEMRGRRPGDVLQCEQTDRETVARISAALRAGESISAEVLNRAKDGRIYWVRMDIQPMRDADGALTGFMAIETDITEAKAAQAQSARAARLGRIVESGLTEIYVFDAGTLAFTEVNRGARENLGYSAEELAGMTPLDIKPDFDRDAFEDLIAPLRSGAEGLLAFRTRHRRCDGSTYPCEIHLQLVMEEPQVFVATVLDITEREAAEEEARRAREQLVTAVESLPDGFVLYDAEDRLVISNARYREFYAESAEAMTPGTPFEEILRHGLRRGQYAEAVGREEAWLAERLAAHRAADHVLEQPLGDGRWLRVLERPTPEGGRVGMRIDITDQVESRARAERAEARLRDAIEALPAAFWLFDADDRLVMFNQRYLDFFPECAPAIEIGASFEDMIRYGLSRGEFPEAAGREEAWLAEVLAQRRAGAYSLEYPTSSGRWIKAYNDPTSDGGMVGFRVDITEEVESRARAEQAEARLRDAIEALPAAVTIFDAEDRLILFNQATLDLFRRSAPAIEIGVSYERLTLYGLEHGEFPDAALPESREAFLAERREKRGAGGVYVREYRVAGDRWVRSYSTPTSAGGVIDFRIDITELRRREDELRAALAERDAAEQRFFDIAAVSADWFWEQDADLRFTYISESFQRTTGGPCDIHIGRTRRELLALNPATLQSADFDWLDARYAAREPFSDFVYRSFAHTDREVWVRISGAPFYDAKGNFAGYRGVGSDVTALYSAMRRAEEASRAKSAFLANMSHEIRTPMNGILGIAEILDMQVHDPEQKRLVATMRESGEILMHILNDILDVSKIEAGKLELDPVPFRPVDLARRIESLHTDRASARGISLAVMTGRGADRERLGDSHRILQILNNLVSNAIKFTEEGEVVVSVREGTEGALVLEVQDSGIGMSEAQKRRIFEDFVQADSSTSRQYGGTGLGMAIVRKLTETMGGEVALDSAPGNGTRVRISLPLPLAGTATADPGSEAEQTGAEVASALAGLRVLACDDNRTNRLVLEAMLHSLGVRPVIVDSGEAAIEATAEARFDLLLLDISMPGLDGMETLAAIRARESADGLPATPAIAVTANAMTHQITLYLAQGFAAHIPKPIRSADLTGAMEEILARPSGREERRPHLDVLPQSMR